MRRVDRERKGEEGQDQFALEGTGRLGVGRACLLKGHVTQVTWKSSIIIIIIIALARTLSTVLSRQGETDQPCFVSDFSGITLPH